MTIYQLRSDAWEVILSYLDVYDTIRLILTGDKTLQLHVKPAIRDFVLCYKRLNSPTLSSLLNTFKDSCSRPLRFSLSLGEYYKLLQFVMEDYTAEKWKTFIPSNLESLELSMECDKLPFSSMLASLEISTPNLKKLCINRYTESLVLPPSLTILDICGEWANPKAPTWLKSLPTTLTHLKLSTESCIQTPIDVSEIPFRKMPLKVFHAHIFFLSLIKEQACWSILPNTIEELHAKLRYMPMSEFFEFPRNPSWKQLFPNLKSLSVPWESLCDPAIAAEAPRDDTSDGQIESIRSSFPLSLTSLKLSEDGEALRKEKFPLVICALGDRLRLIDSTSDVLQSEILKWFPRWENPRVQLLEVHPTGFGMRLVADKSENFEKFLKKDHPLSLLCRSATALNTGILPASVISFLPKTLTSLKFRVAPEEHLSLASASEASNRTISHPKMPNNHVTEDFNPDKPLWEALGWPHRLASLVVTLRNTQRLHLHCLPSTLRKLHIAVWPTCKLEFEGGDLAHMTELSDVFLNSCLCGLIMSLNGLPRSLRSIRSHYHSILDQVPLNPDFQNFFLNLEKLDLANRSHNADILLYLPRTLEHLVIDIGRKGPSLSEPHFEGISRTKLAYLDLRGTAEWPSSLNFNVLHRFMPRTLVHLRFSIQILENKILAVPFFPSTLLEFYSADPTLRELVLDRIRANKLS